MARLSNLGKKWAQRVIAGGPHRKTRFHDEKGNRTSTSRILRNGSRSVLSSLIRTATGSRPQLPWISYDSIAEIKTRITRDWRVLEFGSGMSTIWLSRHAGFVASVEDNPLWHARVHDQLRVLDLKTTVHHLETGQESYVCFMNDDALGFDFILVDGSFRSACLLNALPRMRPGGAVYLANSDKDSCRSMAVTCEPRRQRSGHSPRSGGRH